MRWTSSNIIKFFLPSGKITTQEGLRKAERNKNRLIPVHRTFFLLPLKKSTLNFKSRFQSKSFAYKKLGQLTIHINPGGGLSSWMQRPLIVINSLIQPKLEALPYLCDLLRIFEPKVTEKSWNSTTKLHFADMTGKVQKNKVFFKNKPR